MGGNLEPSNGRVLMFCVFLALIAKTVIDLRKLIRASRIPQHSFASFSVTTIHTMLFGLLFASFCDGKRSSLLKTLEAIFQSPSKENITGNLDSLAFVFLLGLNGVMVFMGYCCAMGYLNI